MDPIQYTFLVLVLTIALFIWDKLRADFVARMSMLALALGGILAPAQALRGFGDSTVIMIGALFLASITPDFVIAGKTLAGMVVLMVTKLIPSVMAVWTITGMSMLTN